MLGLGARDFHKEFLAGLDDFSGVVVHRIAGDVYGVFVDLADRVIDGAATRGLPLETPTA